ncbi:DUF1559 domain-containing protein [Blastopirellula marina]|uniref:DUF1559 domain-containing protein n=1 Tax=Blastopirellula marina DSM 3645 TaxID=314230 RepID=A3ZMI4_9BACT|nr:DUF1559 domain-containing protein [Blastopirellula marina]EAQ82157.1 hypothetical protein DSM3645_00545 [Blastopirellula marina DSM 3645]
MQTFYRCGTQKLNRGFTLLELLFVIGIVVVLVGLLIPTCGTSRESARRAQCANNLKHIGLAVINYDSTWRCLPAAMGGTNSIEDPMQGNANRLSGMISLLPQLEQTALYDQISAPLNADGTLYPAMGPAPWIADYGPWTTQLEFLECPSAAPREGDFGQTNYAFCIGDMAREIHQPTVARGFFACSKYLRFSQITDGASNTIMVGEIGSIDDRLVVGQYAIKQPTSFLEDPSLCQKTRASWSKSNYDSNIMLSDLGRGGRWADGSAGDSLFNTVSPPNSPSCAVDGSEAVDGLYSTGSCHRGGAHVVLGSGAVRFLSQDIDAGDLTQPTLTPQQMSETKVASPYGVWGALGTRNGGETIGDY